MKSNINALKKQRQRQRQSFKDIWNKFIDLKTPKVLVLGFLFIIALGAILLSLDVSIKDGSTLSMIDAIFISTSAVCVTGLTTKSIVGTFTIFGQIVIICLVQIGALGFMTFVCLAFQLLGKRLPLKDKIIFEESFDFTISDMKKLISRIFIFTLVSESIGAILLFFTFLRDYPVLTSIYYSIFHSITAFCNAGFDVLGLESLVKYNTDLYFNVVIMIEIILGSLGYLVVFDILRKFKHTIDNKHSLKKVFRKLTLNSKIVITTTISLIVFGTLLFLIFESYNPNTLKGMPFLDKVTISLFQSVTARTAGFNTIELTKCFDSTKLIYTILMFIGGSPASTAGGIKTVTIAVLFLTAYAMIRNSDVTIVFDRKISSNNIRRAIVVFFLAITLVIVSTIMLIMFENCSFMEAVFESVSAFGTVGSTLNFTKTLSFASKIVLICLMFAGRLGITTVVMAISNRNNKDKNISARYQDKYDVIASTIEYPEEKIILG